MFGTTNINYRSPHSPSTHCQVHLAKLKRLRPSSQSEASLTSRDQLWTNERSLCNPLAAARLLLLHGHEVEAGSGAGSRVSWRHHRRHCGDCSGNWQKKIYSDKSCTNGYKSI